ncbi:tRNA (adenosine(37)-N6)-threonylcarbamoyltransferase complex dimerization subunit type 1 TsaB [Sphingomonas bacterium]|uniref:tRNA (adenosine(37)-N6)-threonylcarbamoyltransferase complex dimerization subunit type 1 TsaB n=1 Tax=Sphingomonas bacterium TaxID=1895847 RepID=UPI001576BD8C|nr:tRNA (adenosine(37)-N6)-threonylcarbamoyltransferase complex dimerization subunit type 1 TsaB [Sphingomonas bacterium]
MTNKATRRLSLSQRTLVIDTATAACSVALIEGRVTVAAIHEEVGRGHAERLIPMIAELPGGGWADRILVDVGPGSFTGIRVGVAAARGLALGWGVPVTGYSALALIANQMFSAAGLDDDATVAVVLEGGHGEVFMQTFADAPFAALDELASLKLADALARIGDRLAFGPGLKHLVGMRQAQLGAAVPPQASWAKLLPEEFTRLPPRPIYGRAPDAKPVPSRAEGTPA